MTNEEAIELLKNGTMFMPTLQNSEYHEAFELAIKALEENERLSLLYSDMANEIARLKSMTGER